MKITHLAIPELILFEPSVLQDDRGFFFEGFRQNIFEEAVGRSLRFVQENHSGSLKGVLRGLHYQLPPSSQGKLVRAVMGEVFDVAVDIRRSSPSFGKWVGVLLSEKNKRSLWIPEGFAHGFMTLSDRAELLYKATNYYAPCDERGILWSDPALGIKWQSSVMPILSAKDNQQPLLSQADVFE